MAKRRGNNEGLIYRRKDGYWVGQYRVQTSTGRKTRYIYGKRREEVREKLTKAIADRDGGFIFDHENMSVRTISEAANRYDAGQEKCMSPLTSLMPNGSALRPPSMMSPLLYSEPVEEEDELTTTTLDEDESDCEEELTCAPESDEIEEKTPSPP